MAYFVREPPNVRLGQRGNGRWSRFRQWTLEYAAVFNSHLACYARGSSQSERQMRKIVCLCLGLGVFIALLSPALAELAMTGAPLTMRDGPSGKAGIVQRIPPSAEISLEKCVRNWCRAWWRGRFGYVPAEAVVLGPPPATLPGDEMPPPLVDALPTYITPPVWRWTGPYVGLNGGLGSGSR
jgi:hypothetical protein